MKSLSDENSDIVQATHEVFITVSMRTKAILLKSEPKHNFVSVVLVVNPQTPPQTSPSSRSAAVVIRQRNVTNQGADNI
jgi:hypothetical protein